MGTSRIQEHSFILGVADVGCTLSLLVLLAAGVTIVTWAPIPSLPWFAWGYWLFILTTPVQVIGGWTFYKGAITAIKGRRANMDFLIALGTTTAYIYSLILLFFLFFPGLLPIDDKNVYFEAFAVIIAISMSRESRISVFLFVSQKNFYLMLGL